MGFKWTNTFQVGAKITNSSAAEIRSNADWLQNNLACIADKTGYQSSHDATHYGRNDTSVQTSQDSIRQRISPSYN